MSSIGESCVANPGIFEVKDLEILQTLEVLHPGVTDLGPTEVQLFEAAQPLQSRKADVGNLGIVKPQYLEAGQTLEVLHPGVADPRAGKVERLEASLRFRLVRPALLTLVPPRLRSLRPLNPIKCDRPALPTLVPKSVNVWRFVRPWRCSIPASRPRCG